jgi:hypothetical protein
MKPKNCYTLLKNKLTVKKPEPIIFTEEAYAKLLCYTHMVGDLEISGFGKVEDNTCTDIIILKQTVRSAYAQIEEEVIEEFIRTTPDRQKYTLDWHSHVKMGTSPSGTDTTNYDEMIALRGGNPFTFLIVNQREDITAGLWLGDGNHYPAKIIVPKTIPQPVLDAAYKECAAQVEALVTKEVYVPIQYNNKYYETYNQYYKPSKDKKPKKTYKPFKDQEPKKKTYIPTVDNRGNFLCLRCGCIIDEEVSDETEGYCVDCSIEPEKTYIPMIDEEGNFLCTCCGCIIDEEVSDETEGYCINCNINLKQ